MNDVPETILIVDDNPENLRLLRSVLDEAKYGVRTATNGAAAIRSVQLKAPDLIILDVIMPEMNGYEVCKQLKANESTRIIPVIFISAAKEQIDKVKSFEAGGVDYIEKPFQAMEVLARVKTHLTLRRMQQDLEILVKERTSALEHAFEELRESEAKHQRLISNLSGTFLYRHNTKGIFEYVSSSVTQVLGYSPEKFLTHFTEYLTDHPVNQEAIKHTEQSIKGITQPPYEVQISHNDGNTRWLEVSEVPVRDESGEIVAVEGVAHNITDRKLAEKEHTRLTQAIEQAGESIIVTDLEGQIEYVNPAFGRTTGYSRDEVIGQPIAEVLVHGKVDISYDHVWETIRSGATWNGQLESVRKDGSVYQVMSTVSPVQDAFGTIFGYVCVRRDISEQVAIETRLRQAQKMEAMGTLAGGIAHDFNNILSAIIGFTDLALDDLPPESEVRESLGNVLEAGHRAKDLVSQILAFSRQTERERIPMRLHTIAKEALKLLRGSIPSTIEIRQNIEANTRPVIADPTEIHQIIMNLCTNAYHAMRETGGVLEVDLIQIELTENDVETDPDLSTGKYIRLTVRDSGCGMNNTTLERLFEPYFTTKERGEGTGLGLSFVHGIVKDIGGAIHVYSELGHGTTFTIFLPIAAMRETEIKKSESGNMRALAGQERVLFVDDEEPLARLAEKALGRFGYKVTLQTNSVEALEDFRKDPRAYDVVITDQMMPKMKGTELAKKLLAIRKDIPIILCSGFGDVIEERATSDAIRDYIMKPVIASDLASSIRRAMDKDGMKEV